MVEAAIEIAAVDNSVADAPVKDLAPSPGISAPCEVDDLSGDDTLSLGLHPPDVIETTVPKNCAPCT